MSTMRLFTAAVARHFALDESSISDLKLAVSESSAYIMMTEPHKEGALIVTIGAHEDRMTVRVADGDPAGRSDDLAMTSFKAVPDVSEEAATLSLDVIGALFPDADLSSEGRTISFSISRNPEPIED